MTKAPPYEISAAASRVLRAYVDGPHPHPLISADDAERAYRIVTAWSKNFDAMKSLLDFQGSAQ